MSNSNSGFPVITLPAGNEKLEHQMIPFATPSNGQYATVPPRHPKREKNRKIQTTSTTHLSEGASDCHAQPSFCEVCRQAHRYQYIHFYSGATKSDQRTSRD